MSLAMAGAKVQGWAGLSESEKSTADRQVRVAILNKLIREQYGPRFGLLTRDENGDRHYEIKELLA